MNKLFLSLYLIGSFISSPLMASKDFVIVEGDIALKKSGDKSSFLRTANRWPGGVIPWMVDQEDANNTKLLNSIKGAMDILNKYTNLVFKKRTEEDKNYIIFTSKNNGCYSYVGMQGGPQEVNLSKGCHHDLIVSHEILHAIGMEHEQSRDDRDSFIDIKWENIKENQKHNFGMVKRSMFGEYNLNSIMHYGSYSFSKNDQPTMTTKEGQTFEQNLKYFSKGDQEAVNNFYPFKFKFDLTQIDVGFSQEGLDNTLVRLKTDPSIIKSIDSVVYKINGEQSSEVVTSWEDNFTYAFKPKAGRNVIVVTFNLKDQTTQEAEFTYFFSGRELSVECRFSAKRDNVDFVVPITYEGEEPSVSSKELRNYFAKVSALLNIDNNAIELKMMLGKDSGLIRRGQKEVRTFNITGNETRKLELDRAELSCDVVNQPIQN